MKTHLWRLAACLGLGFAATALAQSTAPLPASTATVETTTPALSPESLDQLVAPIALYPDALVGIMLPASTYSSDVVLAARYLAAGEDPALAGAQGWDDSVSALAHYPDVVKWMDENLAWTQQLGDNYLAQPAAVMAAIQRDRARARANGSLVDTPQQNVIVDAAGNISIVPAQPTVIYVPRYDPQIVYVERPFYYGLSPLDFGLGFSVGSWLIYDTDWGQRVIWVGNRHNWRDHDWHRPPVGPGRPPDSHQWRPRPDRPRPHPRPPGSPGHPILRPRPYPGTPQVPDRPGAGRPHHPAQPTPGDRPGSPAGRPAAPHTPAPVPRPPSHGQPAPSPRPAPGQGVNPPAPAPAPRPAPQAGSPSRPAPGPGPGAVNPAPARAVPAPAPRPDRDRDP